MLSDVGIFGSVFVIERDLGENPFGYSQVCQVQMTKEYFNWTEKFPESEQSRESAKRCLHRK